MSIKMGSTAGFTQDDDTLSFAMQLSSVVILPYALKLAVDLDLLELMKKKGPGAFVSPVELAAELPTKNPETPIMLDRLLRLLAGYSIVNCRVQTLLDGGIERLYSLAPVCKFYTKNEDGVSLVPSLMMSLDKVLTEIREHVKDAILEGGDAFEYAHKKRIFEYLSKDPRFDKVFNTAMSNNSTIVMKGFLEKYEGFKGIETLVDVGGGTGATLRMILSKHQSMRGINFDLPHVTRNAASYAGVQNIGGDMLVSVPKGDAILMKWILHDWSDTDCLKILKKCHEALPDNGKVIIFENILPENPSEGILYNLQLDVAMLTFNVGGKERTEKEFHALAKQAGFRESYTVCSVPPFWVMEFHK